MEDTDSSEEIDAESAVVMVFGTERYSPARVTNISSGPKQLRHLDIRRNLALALREFAEKQDAGKISYAGNGLKDMPVHCCNCKYFLGLM